MHSQGRGRGVEATLACMMSQQMSPMAGIYGFIPEAIHSQVPCAGLLRQPPRKPTANQQLACRVSNSGIASGNHPHNLVRPCSVDFCWYLRWLAQAALALGFYQVADCVCVWCCMVGCAGRNTASDKWVGHTSVKADKPSSTATTENMAHANALWELNVYVLELGLQYFIQARG